MKRSPSYRHFIWTIAFGLLIFQGCASTTSTTTPSISTQTTAPGTIGTSVSVDPCPFCGVWIGQWEYRHSSVGNPSTRTPDRGVQVEVYQDSSQPGLLRILYTVENGNSACWEQLEGNTTPGVTPPWQQYGTQKRKAQLEHDDDGNPVFYFAKTSINYSKYTLRGDVMEAVAMQGTMKAEFRRIQRW